MRASRLERARRMQASQRAAARRRVLSKFIINTTRVVIERSQMTKAVLGLVLETDFKKGVLVRFGRRKPRYYQPSLLKIVQIN